MDAVLIHVCLFPRAEEPERRGTEDLKPSAGRKEPSAWLWD